MKAHKTTILALLTPGAFAAFGPIAIAADTDEPAVPAAPTVDLAKLEADVGLSAEQKTKVDTLLRELSAKRRALRDDASLSAEDRKAKMKEVNDGNLVQIKALLTPRQFDQWEKLQEARRTARRK